VHNKPIAKLSRSSYQLFFSKTRYGIQLLHMLFGISEIKLILLNSFSVPM